MTDLETSLKECMMIEGAVGAAVVDHASGMALGTAGSDPDLDLGVAAAGNTEVVRAKLRTMTQLGLGEEIEDILITLDSQYHLIRPLQSRRGDGLFLYLVLTKQQASLAMARHNLRHIEEDLQV